MSLWFLSPFLNYSAFCLAEMWDGEYASSHVYENFPYNAGSGNYRSTLHSDMSSVNRRSDSPDPFDTSRVYGK